MYVNDNYFLRMLSGHSVYWLAVDLMYWLLAIVSDWICLSVQSIRLVPSGCHSSAVRQKDSWYRLNKAHLRTWRPHAKNSRRPTINTPDLLLTNIQNHLTSGTCFIFSFCMHMCMCPADWLSELTPSIILPLTSTPPSHPPICLLSILPSLQTATDCKCC